MRLPLFRLCETVQFFHRYFATERMLKIPKGPLFLIFWHCESVKNSHFLSFFRKFRQSLQRVPLQFFFEILQQNGCLKNLKEPPFYSFRHCEIFQNE